MYLDLSPVFWDTTAVLPLCALMHFHSSCLAGIRQDSSKRLASNCDCFLIGIIENEERLNLCDQSIYEKNDIALDEATENYGTTLIEHQRLNILDTLPVRLP